MKHLCFLFILISFWTGATAQSYQYVPWPTGEASWRVRLEVNRDRYNKEVTDFLFYMTGDDTLLNGRIYKKIYSRYTWVRVAIGTTMPLENTIAESPDCFWGGVREDNKRIYFIGNEQLNRTGRCYSETYPDGYLMYDFNLNVGDTIAFQKIQSIDTITIGNTRRKKFVFDKGEYHIEGVGAKTGIFTTDVTSFTKLICFTDQGQTLYTYDGACPYIFPYGTPTSVAGISNTTTISLYPNPCSNVLHIQAPANTTTEVYDMVGRLVMTTNAQSINTSEWRDGLYVVKLYDASQQALKTEQVVKQ